MKKKKKCLKANVPERKNRILSHLFLTSIIFYPIIIILFFLLSSSSSSSSLIYVMFLLLSSALFFNAFYIFLASISTSSSSSFCFPFSSTSYIFPLSHSLLTLSSFCYVFLRIHLLLLSFSLFHVYFPLRLSSLFLFLVLFTSIIFFIPIFFNSFHVHFLLFLFLILFSSLAPPTPLRLFLARSLPFPSSRNISPASPRIVPFSVTLKSVLKTINLKCDNV